ncbi:protein S100-A1-like isoform X2 [Polypterus senegalus]|uniref:protein S100-A1-like isoform X2 n=1 Tax=Polypterus senegalus TaxID=55291 RepID=UPI0019660AE7|nr:protein S100-A1-like isoform X2 [Polypterus senegalus]
MARVELAVYSLLEVFHKYAAIEGDLLQLNIRELQTLLQRELPTIKQDDPLSEMDSNHDGEVDFEEFIIFITKSTASKWESYVRQLLKGTRNEKLEDETSTEKAMTVLIQTFLQYASKEGNPLCLEIKEMKHLLKAEMPTLYKGLLLFCFSASHPTTEGLQRL